jgi:hypothetical protein
MQCLSRRGEIRRVTACESIETALPV